MRLDLHHSHAWDLTPVQALEVQRSLARSVRVEPLATTPQSVGGVDVSVRGDRLQAAVVVLTLPDLEFVEQSTWSGEVTWPYVPGLLSFREVPAVLHALEGLSHLPDVLMVDGQGMAHPRRVGLASHLGLLLEWPALGVAKSRLVGESGEVGIEAGSRQPMMDGGDVVGMVLRTRSGVKPVYISVGHRLTLDEAVALVLACTGRYRLPEPTRQAHLLSRS
jgi:deoxyribonuclease V